MTIHPSVYKLLDAANRGGVPIQTLCKYLKCSRSTIYTWKNGAQPEYDNISKINALTESIESAIESGRLPVNVEAILYNSL